MLRGLQRVQTGAVLGPVRGGNKGHRYKLLPRWLRERSWSEEREDNPRAEPDPEQVGVIVRI